MASDKTVKALFTAMNKLTIEVRNGAIEDFKGFLSENMEDSAPEIEEFTDQFKSTLPAMVISSDATGKKSKADKKTRPPNEYNKFISEKMKELRLQNEGNKEYSGKIAMSEASRAWKAEKNSRSLLPSGESKTVNYDEEESLSENDVDETSEIEDTGNQSSPRTPRSPPSPPKKPSKKGKK